eukprot:306662-Chlamydomonas_euryale.AAC.3
MRKPLIHDRRAVRQRHTQSSSKDARKDIRQQQKDIGQACAVRAKDKLARRGQRTNLHSEAERACHALYVRPSYEQGH